MRNPFVIDEQEHRGEIHPVIGFIPALVLLVATMAGELAGLIVSRIPKRKRK